MTPEEFLSLPPGVALRVLFDCLDEGTVAALGAQEPLKAPLPPMYDQAIYRSGGVQWASETDLEGLRFWHKRALEPPSDPKYTEANRKRAESLARWITWREWFPDTAWSGKRDGKDGVARSPTRYPKLHVRDGAPPRRQESTDGELDPNADIPY